jgi:alpha-beta hydrolase superfamily lysophospholipase
LKTSFFITDQYGKKLHTLKWVPEGEEVKGVVQICHGVAEHAERYGQFARFLNRIGLAVYAHDHRGHGKTDPDSPGYVESPDTFSLMVENIEDVRIHLTRVYPNLPHIMFGHSMGSFLLQRYMQTFDFKPAALIYSGSSGKPPLTLGGGILLSGIIRKYWGDRAQSLLIHKLTFGAYNKSFEPADTEFDWLSRDREMVGLYIDDRFCGFIPTVSFYHDLFRGLKSLHRHPAFAENSRDIPTLILSGSKDPVSSGEKGLRSLEKILRDSGVTNLTVKLYPDGRHEMLNETNRIEVMGDILEWLKPIVGVNNGS